jgi:MFS family permease
MAVDTVSTGKSSLGLGSLMVFAAFLAFGVVFGTCFYSFTLLVKPLAAAFNVPPPKIVEGFVLFNVGTGILGIFGGKLLTRFSIRNIMVVGCLIMAVAFFGLSKATELWQYYALYAIVAAFGGVILAPLGAAAIVTNWFTAGRGRALTLATLGTSFGQLVIPQVVAKILAGPTGYHGVYQAFAIMMVIVAVPIFFMVIDRPEKKGLTPYGGEPVSTTAPPTALLTNGQILGNPSFWLIAVTYICTVSVYLAITATIVPYATAIGSTVVAAKVVLVAGMAAIVGKLFFAAVTDRIGLRNTLWIAIALNLTALVMLLFVKGDQAIFIASGCVGGAAGGVLPVLPGMVAARFGRANLPQAMGLMGPIVFSLQGMGSLYAASVKYTPAFYVFIGMLVLSALLAMVATKPAKI